MAQFVVIGSMNLDLVAQVSHIPARGESIIADGFDTHTGGKGGNQAYAIARLGGDVAMLGAVGTDDNGGLLLDSLKRASVDTAFIKRTSEAATGMAWIAVSREGDNSIIVLPGANHAVSRAYIDANIDVIKGCDTVVMQLEIPLDTVEYAARIAHELGKRVILDPAPAQPGLPRELFACADIVKPNETELSILTGVADAADHLDDAARALQAMGARNVLVTLGGDGAYLLTENGVSRRFASHKVQVVDTTAAGDSFTAALALRLGTGDGFGDAILYAMRVAEIVVTRPGAQSSIPSFEELESIMAR